MDRQKKLKPTTTGMVIDLLLEWPALPAHIKRSRWVIARCALFVGLAAISFATLLLNLSWRTAIAG